MTTPPKPPSVGEIINELTTVISERRDGYALMIKAGRISQEEADRRLAALGQALAVLKAIFPRVDLIRWVLMYPDRIQQIKDSVDRGQQKIP
jgi:NurA-like 5'-3' nuclease